MKKIDKTLEFFIKEIEKNKFSDFLKRIEDENYNFSILLEKLNNHIEYNMIDYECGLNIIIPVRGRTDFLKKILNLLHNENLSKYNSLITVVEHDNEPINKNLCFTSNVNYIFIRNGEKFNKSLCINLGSVLIKSENILIYDVDMILKRGFIDLIYKNIENYGCEFLQCFTEEKVLALNDDETKSILEDKLNVEDLSENYNNFNQIHISPAGGLIWVTKKLFLSVGGMDDFLFKGWGAEDTLFMDKCKLLSDVKTAENPKIFIYHLNHERVQKEENNFKEYEKFNGIENSYKNEILNKIKQMFEDRIEKYIKIKKQKLWEN